MSNSLARVGVRLHADADRPELQAAVGRRSVPPDQRARNRLRRHRPRAPRDQKSQCTHERNFRARGSMVQGMPRRQYATRCRASGSVDESAVCARSMWIRLGGVVTPRASCRVAASRVTAQHESRAIRTNECLCRRGRGCAGRAKRGVRPRCRWCEFFVRHRGAARAARTQQPTHSNASGALLA